MMQEVGRLLDDAQKGKEKTSLKAGFYDDSQEEAALARRPLDLEAAMGECKLGCVAKSEIPL